MSSKHRMRKLTDEQYDQYIAALKGQTLQSDSAGRGEKTAAENVRKVCGQGAQSIPSEGGKD